MYHISSIYGRKNLVGSMFLMIHITLEMLTYFFQDHGNYAFGYQIVDHHGNTNGRQEAGHGGHHVHGSYNLALHDGRVRKVEYVADGHGFRAAIKTNEPGTQHSLPAAVDMDSPYKGFAAGSYGISHGGYGGNDGGYGRGNGAGYGAGRGNGYGYGHH
ncbi:hypothetical protein LAZ67_23000242 [Cordylochernes scorpioides]|uniref:Uncharacterized protein n=1 Tax=Cordylochernes scorpioides TaxID=51811 RepID=A0ABY6LQ52_9ARAC|nr:hypothetical protein LAZ67_23000242 [Cordylochernes scorpioides]